MSELVGTELENVSLFLLSEPKTRRSRALEEVAFKELAESIRTKSVLSPLLVALSHKMGPLLQMRDSHMSYTVKPDEEDNDCVK